MEITEKMRGEVLTRASRRCECQGPNCKHHRKGGRCKNGLRGWDWKIYWRTEGGAAQAWNLEAWCNTCFDNNFPKPERSKR